MPLCIKPGKALGFRSGHSEITIFPAAQPVLPTLGRQTVQKDPQYYTIAQRPMARARDALSTLVGNGTITGNPPDWRSDFMGSFVSLSAYTWLSSLLLTVVNAALVGVVGWLLIKFLLGFIAKFLKKTKIDPLLHTVSSRLESQV
jgi:hypothetical protein